MDLVQELTRLLIELPNVRLAAVFGSFAGGHSVHPHSDVDLAIELADDSFDSRIRLEMALTRVAKRQVDIAHLHEAPPLLRFEIARHGRLLVERQPHAWADFKARAMLDWWDWAPYARRIHAAAAQRLREETRRGAA